MHTHHAVGLVVLHTDSESMSPAATGGRKAELPSKGAYDRWICCSRGPVHERESVAACNEMQM